MKYGVPRIVSCNVVKNKSSQHEMLNPACTERKIFIFLRLFNTTLTT
jgi:hypothetical protein